MWKKKMKKNKKYNKLNLYTANYYPVKLAEKIISEKSSKNLFILQKNSAFNAK